jgi:hypothetical protein
MKAPLEMPTDFFSQVDFDPQRVDYGAPEASGRVGGVQAGFPLWIATTRSTSSARTNRTRVARSRTRCAERPALPRPRPHPPLSQGHRGGFAGMVRAGGGAFDGTATAWSEAITADGDSQVTLHGLPAGSSSGSAIISASTGSRPRRRSPA